MLKYVLMCLVGLIPIAGCQAQDTAAPATAKRQWEAGKDYALINPPVPVKGDKVVVTEVFSYACPHCAHYQPYADDLKAKLPAGAQFELLPAVFNPTWEPFARAFYTAKSMGLLDKTHQALFDAVHRDHQPLHTLEDLANLFYSNYGANPGSFLSTATSFVIEGEMAQDAQRVRDYGVEATPTLIVNGKYRVSMNSEHGIGPPETVQIALDLVKQELAAKNAAKK
jgi:protein dithiol oxidoreductase (disulfide-forming)